MADAFFSAPLDFPFLKRFLFRFCWSSLLIVAEKTNVWNDDWPSLLSTGSPFSLRLKRHVSFQQMFHGVWRYLLRYARSEAYNAIELGEVTSFDHPVRFVQHKELDAPHLSSYVIVLTCGA